MSTEAISCFQPRTFSHDSARYLKNFFKHKQFVHITLFGGEPLLEAARVFDYLDFLNSIQDQYGFYYDTSIGTNGYLLDDDRISSLVHSYNCKTFQITIDGYKLTHNKTRQLRNGRGSYDKVINNFKILVKKNMELDKQIDPNLRVNLLNNSLSDVETLLNEFSETEKGFFRMYFRPVYNTKNFCTSNKNRINLESFYDMARSKGFNVGTNVGIKQNFCEGDSGINQMQIMPNLSVWKCINDLDFDGAKIGVISSKGELDMLFNNLEIWSRNDPFQDEKCIACKFLPTCLGGCPLYYAKTGERKCLYEKDFDIYNLFL